MFQAQFHCTAVLQGLRNRLYSEQVENRPKSVHWQVFNRKLVARYLVEELLETEMTACGRSFLISASCYATSLIAQHYKLDQ